MKPEIRASIKPIRGKANLEKIAESEKVPDDCYREKGIPAFRRQNNENQPYCSERMTNCICISAYMINVIENKNLVYYPGCDFSDQINEEFSVPRTHQNYRGAREDPHL
ncbi:MAG: hypothetical protein Q8O89_06735 [Nanoarchaeota archaeon]|nr:hypothetical protein [Nanoarchaeota archaeon]